MYQIRSSSSCRAWNFILLIRRLKTPARDRLIYEFFVNEIDSNTHRVKNSTCASMPRELFVLF